jgi:hypothetical protein
LKAAFVSLMLIGAAFFVFEQKRQLEKEKP